MKRLLLFIVLAASASAEIIPATRRVTWTGNAGIPGGIPDSSLKTVFTNISAGASFAVIQAAIDSCPSNQVIQLAAGSYSGTATLDWLGNQGVILRGAGMAATTLTWTTFSEAGMKMRGINYSDGPFSVEAALSANAAKGDTTITLASVPSWVQVGDLIAIDELNNTNYVKLPGSGGGGESYRELMGNGSRNKVQLVRVTAKDATTITLEVPLYTEFHTANTAQIFQPGYDPSAATPLQFCGVEDLTLAFSFNGTADTHPVKAEQIDNCWMKNVKFASPPGGRCVWTWFSYRCQFQNVWVDNPVETDAGEGYGFDISQASAGMLIEDCIFIGTHIGATADYGASGNVYAYCYQADGKPINGQAPAFDTHGPHPMMNLVEGWYAQEKILGDYFYGSSSHNTYFRNRVTGENNSGDQAVCISLEYYQKSNNIVANVLGTSGKHNKRVSHTGSTAEGSQGSIMKLGGEININNDYSPGDAYSYTSGMFVMDHCNADTITDGIVLNGSSGSSISDTNPPTSLYYTSAPSYFTSGSGGVVLTWPLYDPATPATWTNLPPAGLRYLGITNYGLASGAATPTSLRITGAARTSGPHTFK